MNQLGRQVFMTHCCNLKGDPPPQPMVTYYTCCQIGLLRYLRHKSLISAYFVAAIITLLNFRNTAPGCMRLTFFFFFFSYTCHAPWRKKTKTNTHPSLRVNLADVQLQT